MSRKLGTPTRVPLKPDYVHRGRHFAQRGKARGLAALHYPDTEGSHWGVHCLVQKETEKPTTSTTAFVVVETTETPEIEVVSETVACCTEGLDFGEN